ncbi:hypothetical protein M3P05_20770, partial [Sansalvadorimonas sp. 2012CJ34-2]
EFVTVLILIVQQFNVFLRQKFSGCFPVVPAPAKCSQGFVQLPAQNFTASISHLHGVKIGVNSAPLITIPKLAVNIAVGLGFPGNSANKLILPAHLSLLPLCNASTSIFKHRRKSG